MEETKLGGGHYDCPICGRTIFGSVLHKCKNYIECSDCEGKGWTAEHNPNDPHIGGVCVDCPIQVHCEKCEGTGKIKLD